MFFFCYRQCPPFFSYGIAICIIVYILLLVYQLTQREDFKKYLEEASAAVLDTYVELLEQSPKIDIKERVKMMEKTMIMRNPNFAISPIYGMPYNKDSFITNSKYLNSYKIAKSIILKSTYIVR